MTELEKELYAEVLADHPYVVALRRWFHQHPELPREEEDTARRIERELSQTELARRVGVTRQTIGLIESGEFNPSIKLCVAICRALGVTLNDLFWEEDENEAEEK